MDTTVINKDNEEEQETRASPEVAKEVQTQASPEVAKKLPADAPTEWRINLDLEKVPAAKKIDYSKPFMLRFDANKVGSPFALMDKETGKDPEWTVVGMFHQLFDPAYETRAERFIAIWHNKANAAWFPEKGFLKEDENNPGSFEWAWKPDHDPFQKKKSKIS